MRTNDSRASWSVVLSVLAPPQQKRCGRKNLSIIVGFSSLHRLYTHRCSAQPSWRHRPFCHDLTLQTTIRTTTTTQPTKSNFFIVVFHPNKARYYLPLLMCGLPVQLWFQLDRRLVRKDKMKGHRHGTTCHHTMLLSLC